MTNPTPPLTPGNVPGAPVYQPGMPIYLDGTLVPGTGNASSPVTQPAPGSSGPANATIADRANSSVSASSSFIGLQGQKFGAATNALNYINPLPDRRLNSILGKTGSPLKQGIIQQTDANVSNAGTAAGLASIQNYPFACRFMFNPPDVSVGYGINNDILPYEQMTTAQLQAKSFYPGMTTISFSLLFDRTYEVAYGTPGAYLGDLSKIGVYADIAALESVVGVRSLAAKTASYTLDTSGNPVASGAAKTITTKSSSGKDLIGNMVLTPVYIIFGGGQDNAGLSFAAYITSMQVSYALFSQNMIPTRASVQIGATQLVGEDPYPSNGTLPERLAASGRVSTVYGGNFAPGDLTALGYDQGTFPPLPGTVN